MGRQKTSAVMKKQEHVTELKDERQHRVEIQARGYETCKALFSGESIVAQAPLLQYDYKKFTSCNDLRNHPVPQ